MMKFLLIAASSFFISYYSFSQNVTLGTETGAGSTNVLLSTSTTTNKYSRTISIYTAAEIIAAGGTAGSISSLWWKKGGTGEYQFGNAEINIYIKNTPNTQWPAVPVWDTEIAGAMPVFSSTTYSIPAGTGFKQVIFNTPFAWDGTSNIAVYVDWYRPGTPTADITWARSTTTSTNAARVGATLASLNPLLLNNNRPLLQLQIDPPLPVKLVSFSAVRKNEDIHLSWLTQTEQNCHHFEIEAGDNGSTFTYCGTIAATGNSTALKTYAFVHHYPLLSANNKNLLFYRLKMIDNDGHFSYSNIVKVSLQESYHISVYPNPVKDVFTLSVNRNSTGSFTYTLSGIDGRVIQKRTTNISSPAILTIDALQQQPAGTYILQVQIGKEYSQIKIIKQ